MWVELGVTDRVRIRNEYEKHTGLVDLSCLTFSPVHLFRKTIVPFCRRERADADLDFPESRIERK